MRFLACVVFAALLLTPQKPQPKSGSGESGVKKGDAQVETEEKQQVAKPQRNPVGAEQNQPPATAYKNETYDPRNDSLYRWYLGAAILASVVGLGTLLAVYKQGQALVLSQRAQLAAKPHGNPPKDILSNEPRLLLAVENVGATAAYDLTYESWIEVLTFPFSGFTDMADHHIHSAPSALYPRHLPMVINIPIRAGLNAQERRDVLDCRRYVCVRVLVRYRDIFDKKRYANFGYYALAEGMSWLPKYNDAN